MTRPRVFIGTMYCGEGDFTQCCDAIDKQSGVSLMHVTVNNLPEKEAHNALWSSWRQARHNFDMFVKVDADTVLAHDEVLLEFWKVMEANPRVTGIQAPLLDYFTDGYINGLNCFSPRVTFRDTADELFCDRQVDVDHDIVLKAGQVPERLRHAGYHCHHATEAQAFHFGLHRALKNQTQILALVRQAWKRHGDRQRALALLGASLAGNFRDGGFNYIDQRFQLALDAVLSRYDEMVDQLSREGK